MSPPTLDSQELPFWLHWLALLKNSQIRKVSQPFRHCIQLEVYGKQGEQQWLFSSHSTYPRVCQSWKKFKNPQLPPIFCLWLRKRITNGIITDISSVSSTIIQFFIQTKEFNYGLVWEANGPQSNLLLLDENQKLLIALNNPNQLGRRLVAGVAYHPPTVWETPPSRLAGFFKKAQTFDQHYWQMELEGNIHDSTKAYQKHFKSITKKLNRKLINQESDLEHCQTADQFRQWGELLKPHLHEIASGQKSVDVVNYFDERLPVLTLRLQPEKSPSENLEYYFQKANKLNKAIPHVEKRILQTMEELEQLEQLKGQLSELGSMNDFRQWEGALPKLFKIKPKASSGPNPQESDGPGPLIRVSSEGFPIVIGKNKEQNVQVSFSIAKGNDWWMHAQGVPGSHVVVKCRNAQLPSQTLYEAAQLAAYYSKARKAGKVEVDYTQRKHIRKVKGGPPGTVLISHNKSIFVEIDESLIKTLLDQES